MRDWRKYIFKDEPFGLIIASVVVVMVMGTTVVYLTAWLLLS